ncbi:MAG: PIN domain-containing protein [Microcystis aeruginosa Ma_SC_T_19800800_S464]|jgi:predicted nucleic acid-binding protein|uniref:PIN domain-containing protein n=1 Tax=Microcystis aeruginosa Ma_SC_T_19800800_S464 TaxID=2486257 RepID=A0A552DVL2_MICAE|nr:MAG: PIN domain-containing protein [Microcystis aeruginosa Ma_SC_T_19800800_S464]
MTAILDTSFLFALTDQSDRNHERVLAVAQSINESLVLPVVVLPEVCYLIGSRLGHQAMRRFVSSITPDTVQVEPLMPDDLVRVHEILEQYADNQLDFTDAAIIAIAERLNITRVYTIDRRDFSIIRPSHCDYFELFP